MPGFPLLAEEDLQAVVDYVLVLTHRGELELLLALEAANDDSLDPENVTGYIEEITGQWKQADGRVVTPVTRPVAYSPESVEKGKQAFLSETAGCYKCHGADGRGLTLDNAAGFKDAWGFQTRAADLSSGMFHGGDRSLDIYRRIYSGINGTPMPSFDVKLGKDPEMFWHLVNYVKFVSSARRREVVKQHPLMAGAAVAAEAAAD